MRDGWIITIETTGGVVIFYTGRSDKELKLFYPLNIDISDEMITEILNVTLADSGHDYCDNKFHKGAKYYFETPKNNSSVWIGKAHEYNFGLFFGRTIADKNIQHHAAGIKNTNIIWTCDSRLANESLDCRGDKVQAYKERFFQLFITIAKLTGNIIAINFDSDESIMLYTPEILKNCGYAVEEEMYNEEPTSIDYDRESICCYTQTNGVEVILTKKYNKYITILRYPASNEITSETLSNLIEKFTNSEELATSIPLL